MTGKKLSDRPHEIALGELSSRVHTILGNENKVVSLRCEYPKSQVLNERSRMHDVLFIYERREIIGTKDWYHPKFEKEWNDWAKVAYYSVIGIIIQS